MFENRFRKTYKKSFTTDDLMELGECKNYSILLKIKNQSIKLWKLLKEINQILYHENTKIILINKPIFDNQKNILVSLDTFIETNYKNGLIKHNYNFKNNFTNKFIFNTQFKEWNELATEINKSIDILNKEINDEIYIKNLIKPKQKIHGYYFKYIILLILLCILCFFIIYYKTNVNS